MKKVMFYAAVAALLVSSCGTYQGSGAYVGAQFGSILGSAIGGISNGHRGSNIGTIVGMVGGAVVGSAIGAAADQKDKQEVRDRYHKVMERKAQEQNRQYDNDGYDSGFDATMSGDDRLYDRHGGASGRMGHLGDIVQRVLCSQHYRADRLAGRRKAGGSGRLDARGHTGFRNGEFGGIR